MYGNSDLNTDSVGTGCFCCFKDRNVLYNLRQQPKVLYSRTIWATFGYSLILKVFLGPSFLGFFMFLFSFFEIFSCSTAKEFRDWSSSLFGQVFELINELVRKKEVVYMHTTDIIIDRLLQSSVIPPLKWRVF